MFSSYFFLSFFLSYLDHFLISLSYFHPLPSSLSLCFLPLIISSSSLILSFFFYLSLPLFLYLFPSFFTNPPSLSLSSFSNKKHLSQKTWNKMCNLREEKRNLPSSLTCAPETLFYRHLFFVRKKCFFRNPTMIGE